MPELPEVETVRRMLDAHVKGRRIRSVAFSGRALRQTPPDPSLPRRARGRVIEAVRRHGKLLLIELGGGDTLLSHLGMSGRWLFYPERPPRGLAHVHVRIAFADGSRLWFQDPRRFGMFRIVAASELAGDPALAPLGPDPLSAPPRGEDLARSARGSRVAVKVFLLDQRRLAGIGNIYASEILHRARVHPGRAAGRLEAAQWDRIARETRNVLDEATERMGTTFSMYRTLWGEAGAYGEQLLVYDRASEPCRTCGARIRRVVQAQRSTFYCPRCQRGRFHRGR